MKIKADYTNAPSWKILTVKATLPEELKCLDEIAHNMWWVWNFEARDLFRDLDPELYHDVKHNPVMLLERLSYERKEEILKDKALMKRIKSVYDMFRKYMDVKPDSKRPSVAYFCMEYGIHSALKIYSGGLGMLAGDYVKEASDSNVDMCAVGFLYRFGYFTQSLSMDGQQIANYETQNFGSLPIERQLDKDGNPLVIDVPYTNYQVHAYVWRVNVGRVKLYLLDTDNEMNSEFDKPITHALYGGDWENRSASRKISITVTRVTQHSATCSVCAIISRKTVCHSIRLWNWFVPAVSIPYIPLCLQVTTTSTRASSVSTWVAIPPSWESPGTSLSAWVVPIPTTMARSSVCQPSPATPVRRLMVYLCFTAGYLRRCSLPSGTVTILRRTTWATSPMVFTSPHGLLLSGVHSMASTSMRSS